MAERAAHTEELRGLVASLQTGQGRGVGGVAKKKATKRRRTPSEG